MLNHIHGLPEQDEMFACFLQWEAWKGLSHGYPYPQAPQSGSIHTVEHSLRTSGSSLPSQELCWFGSVETDGTGTAFGKLKAKKAKTLALWE